MHGTKPPLSPMPECHTEVTVFLLHLLSFFSGPVSGCFTFSSLVDVLGHVNCKCRVGGDGT
jgi:hypothetical protein